MLSALSFLPTKDTSALPTATGVPSAPRACALQVSLLSKFLIVKCFKKATKRKFPQDGKQKGKSCCNWEHRGPPRGSPASASLPYPWPPPHPLFPGGRCLRAFVSCFRCENSAHSGFTPIIPSGSHTLGQSEELIRTGRRNGSPGLWLPRVLRHRDPRATRSSGLLFRFGVMRVE